MRVDAVDAVMYHTLPHSARQARTWKRTWVRIHKCAQFAHPPLTPHTHTHSTAHAHFNPHTIFSHSPGRRPNLKDDIVLAGAVSWVGRSSMEISMTATSDWTDEPWLSVRVGARYERSNDSSCMCVCTFTKRVCTECVSVELVLSLSLALTHPDDYIDTATHHGQQR